MKTKLIGLSILAVISLTTFSCDDDKEIQAVDLPATSSTFLSTYFNGVKILRVEKEGSKYAVDLENKIEVDFNENGEWTEVDGQDGVTIPTGFILPNIVEYVTTTYPDNSINGIEKKTGGYDVDLMKQDIDLIFDQDGDFVRVDP
jgi:hypothetical protein